MTFADISKIKRLLGWEPRVDIENGVERVLEHVDDWSRVPVWSEDEIAEATRVWFDVLGKATN
jgi:UDP-glucose 4-epimerase